MATVTEDRIKKVETASKAIADQNETLTKKLKASEEEASVVKEQNKLLVKHFSSPDYSGSGTKRIFANARDHRTEFQGRFKSMSHQLDTIRKAAYGRASGDDMAALNEAPKILEAWYREKGYNEDFITKAAGLSESAGPDGGFLLMPTWAANVLEIMHDFDNLLDRCDRYEMASPSMKFRAVDETSLATTRRGGVLGYWVDEAATITSSKPKYRLIDLIPHKVAVLTYLTDELLADGPMAEQYTSRYAAEELTFQINDALINGTGAGKPLGILNAASTVSVSKETGQGAATLLTENIVKMYARLHSSSRGNACWFVNQDTLPQLLTLTLAIGTAGMMTFMPFDQGVTKTPAKQLLGLPIIEIPWCATLGTVGDVILADMKQFIAATRGSVVAANSIHINFLTDETAFRWTMRVAGQPWWNSALTPFKGSNTQSAFITLATRA